MDRHAIQVVQIAFLILGLLAWLIFINKTPIKHLLILIFFMLILKQ
jgi:hypothetical protein